MAENKTKATAVSVEAYLDSIADEGRRADARVIAGVMREIVGEPAKMWGPSIVGFGSRHYRYESGREGDMPLACFSPRATATVLYGLTGFDGAEKLLGNFGRYTRGKGCLYVKRIEDVSVDVLRKLVTRAVAAGREGGKP